MRFHRSFSHIMDSPIKVDILRFLVKTGAEWNGREIAKELKISPAACHKALKSLNYEGVILLRTTGKTHLYHINQNHLITKNLLTPLLGWEIRGAKNLTDLIIPKLEKYTKRYFVSLALFGSIIKGKEKPDSDIDLLVLIKNTNDKKEIEGLLEELSHFLTRTTGNALAPYIQTVNEFRQKYRKGLPVTRNIVNSHLLLRGKPIKDVL